MEVDLQTTKPVKEAESGDEGLDDADEGGQVKPNRARPGQTLISVTTPELSIVVDSPDSDTAWSLLINCFYKFKPDQAPIEEARKETG